MKNKSTPLITTLALLALALLNPLFSSARAQGTAFTYQGRLNYGTNPVTGGYQMTFALFNASSGGTQIGSTLTNSVGVTNGLFITTLDFGPVFNDTAAWLAIGVRTNGAASFTSLGQLQDLTPTPFAMVAENVTGVVPLAQLPAVVSLLSDPGSENFFAGPAAGNTSLSGTGDIGMGDAALEKVSTGSYNTADGVFALQYDTTGSYNSGFGAYALQWDTTGSYNTASGVFALSSEPSYVTGSGNTADGANSLYSLGTGSNNVAMGFGALYSAAGDNGVVAIGYQALQHDSYLGGGEFSFTIGSGNTAVGYESMQANTNGSANTAVGYLSLYSNLNGYQNSAFGLWALLANTSGYNNSAVGALAMFANTSGYQNTAAGVSALEGNSSGFDNVAIGYGALESSTDDNGVVAIGFEALQNDSTTGGFLSVGSGNTGIGYQSLQASTSGADNTAIGYQSLYQNTTGYNNLALGVWAMLDNVSGDNNTAVGTYALDGLTSGSGNIALGEGAGSGLVSGNNNIYIGASAGANDNNVIRIGSGDTQIFLTGAVQGNTGISGINVDPNGLNIGNVNSNALTFGISSGEGICSKRANGPTPRYDLELWTDFNERLKIAQYGNVGIGTDNPGATLEVNGDVCIDGNPLLLNATDDSYTGLGYYSSGLQGISFGEGPLLYGFNGGALGSVYPTAVSLSWNYLGDVWVSNNLSTATLTIRGGADLAEPFNITPANNNDDVPQGAVVVIDDQNPGHLKLSDRPYDARVAGVVSGANGINPGIQMHQQGILEGGKNVALTGRVYVQADASNGPIRPGDQLTTSTVPGRAMRVSDHARAQGAILGKAMTALDSGRGIVLVLVTLQ